MTSTNYRPEDRHDVAPWIIGHHTLELIAWLREVFDATDIAEPMVGEDGSVSHAEVRIGDSVVMLFDRRDWPPTPAFLRIYCPDVNAVHERAVAAGGRSITRPTHLFWGDLAGRVADPFGNVYWINQKLEDVTPEEMAARMSDPVFTANMEYVTSADVRPGSLLPRERQSPPMERF